jgi:hypothetical protein
LHLCCGWTCNIFGCKYFNYHGQIPSPHLSLITPQHPYKHQPAKERARSITLIHCP